MTWNEVLAKGVKDVKIFSYGYTEVSIFSSHFEPFKNQRTFKFKVTPFGLEHAWLFLEEPEKSLDFFQDENGEIFLDDPDLWARP